MQRLWGDGGVRVFISHTAEQKEFAKSIQTSLETFGIASFVAHEDIEPMRDWEGEIEKALQSMDLLLALLTEDFNRSKWTDQEVGYAVGRGVDVIPVRMGADPYGFMGRYQAIRGDLGAFGIAKRLLSYTLAEESVKSAAIDSFISAVSKSESFNRSNQLASWLEEISELTDTQEDALVRAYNSNSQVFDNFVWRGAITEHLKRWTGKDYEFTGHKLSWLELPF